VALLIQIDLSSLASDSLIKNKELEILLSEIRFNTIDQIKVKDISTFNCIILLQDLSVYFHSGYHEFKTFIKRIK
jgi:hypothetical protein